MIDTGANVSLVSRNFVTRCLRGQENKKKDPFLLKGMNQKYCTVSEEIQMARIQHQDRYCLMDIDVVENLNGECILGLDWLDQTGFLIDPLKRQLLERPQFDFKQCAMTVWARPVHRPMVTEKQVNRMAKSDD